MSDLATLVQQRIRETAYRLWEAAGRPENQELYFWLQAEAEIQRAEARLDQELADSFPASDPSSSVVRPRKP